MSPTIYEIYDGIGWEAEKLILLKFILEKKGRTPKLE